MCEKSSKNILDRGLLKTVWKSWNFCRKSTGIYRKTQDNQDLMNDLDWTGKTKQNACKTLRVWTKGEENIEIFQENFELFWSKSLWKFDFFHNFLLNISWISGSAQKVYRPLEDNTRFLQPIFRFLGGDVPAFPPPPDATLCLLSRYRGNLYASKPLAMPGWKTGADDLVIWTNHGHLIIW